jgi:hypothetical protein
MRCARRFSVIAGLVPAIPINMKGHARLSEMPATSAGMMSHKGS